MRNKKLLFILIPVIIVVLVLIAGIVFVALNSSPEKIFKNSISKVFEVFETTEEQFTTMKGTMKLTASIETDSEEMQAINTMLEGTSINLDMQADTANMVINENLNVTVNNESLLNAAILLQDQKGYVYLKDYLDKYLELPEEDMDYSELTDVYDKIPTLDQNALMEAIKEELIAVISSRELTQDKIDKRKVSILDLSQEEFALLCKEILENLKQNEMFNYSLGEYKEDVIVAMDDMIADFDDVEYDEDSRAVISIYTEGLLNRFAGFSIELKDGMDTEVGMLLAIGKVQSIFTTFEEYDGERKELLNVTIEDRKENKNKGTATITMTADEEQFVVTYNYETQGNKKLFVASTEIEGVGLSVSGNITEEGNNIKGNMTISVQEETFGKFNLNFAYDFTYGVQIQKVDTRNSVLIDELSEEDQTTLMTNLQNSALYQFIEQSGLLDSGLGSLSDEPEVTYDGYTVMYTVPEGFEISEYSSEDFKMYMDDNYNSINVTINYDTVDTYMKELEDEYVLTSEFYENQKISDIKSMNINGKEYKLRTITYSDEYDSYANLYFAYGLDEEYCYVVEVESENGNISMDTIKKFLDVTIE